MTEREPLEDAVERLRAFAREVPAEARATRQRVLDHGTPATRRRLKAWLAAFALLALGAPVLAQVTGVLAPLIDEVSSWLDSASDARDRATPPPRATSALPPSAAPAPQPKAAETVEPEQPPIAPANVERARTTARSVRASDPGERARSLYMTAHEAHFGGGSPEAALAAWDAFLAAAPNDAFAPEARYNRAILLAKLQRPAQAITALEPFACAAQGAYRQREARALIARLHAQASSLALPACLAEPSR